MPGTSGRLLIVDDSSTVRRSIERHIFSERVTEIYQAANGLEAMELFERYRPEYVTMDLTMPEMDGLTCISKMMTLKPDTRLMVISALGDAETAIEAVERGANEYVVKPFSAEDLNLALANLVAGV
ncbi:MAG: two-component system, chemotaxis family, chemotaxis protein CheY [Acidobacteriota bacterium]|nr:two-component system, chemotaxis family, chemotaxis protein CheY [Acidobacteriota bacterium]